MNTLKEQDGRYYQEAEVVLLDTKSKSFLFLNKKRDWLKQSNIILEDHPKERNQYIYITSNEEIKEGDWVIDGALPLSPLFVIQVTKEDLERCINNWKSGSCKKIIATTDETLYTDFNNGKTDLKFVLPQPSDSFISKYIEEYNKDNTITNVLVEYEKVYPKHFTYNPSENMFINLKVDSNNTITIKKVKDSYSREEVVALLEARDKHLEAEKKELLEALENLIEDEQLSSEAMENEIESLIQKHK